MRRYEKAILIGGIATLALAGCARTTRPAATPPPAGTGGDPRNPDASGPLCGGGVVDRPL